MKKLLLVSTTILLSNLLHSQTATNFTVSDCSGGSHNLFSELNEGKIIVLCWVMPCGACAGPTKTAFNVVNSYQTSNPGRVLFYLVDDYANNSCNDITGWASGIGVTNQKTFINQAISMDDYGSAGMLKIVVLGGSDHKVLYNANNTVNSTTMQNAIDNAVAFNVNLPDTKVVCGTQPVPFTTIPVMGGTPPYTFTWNTQDGLTFSGDSVTFAPTVTTSYILTVKDNSGNTKTDSLVYFFKKKIEPDFSYQIGYGSPMTVKFTNTSQNITTHPYSTDVYAWTLGQGSSSDKDPVFKYKSTGTFTVIMYASNECGSKSVSKTIAVTSINETLQCSLSSLDLFSNPVDDKAILSFNAVKPLTVSIDVYNSIGVKTKTIFSGTTLQGKNTLEFNTREMNNGLYFIKMNPSRDKMMKLMVAH